MLRNALSGFNLREFNPNIRRFFLFGIPLSSGMALFTLLYNLYLLRLGHREDFIGQISGLLPLASGIFAIPTAILSDRIGRKPFLFATSLVMGASQLGMCLTTHPTLLLTLSFVGGTAGAFVFVNFIPFLAENAAPERRGQGIAIWMAIQGFTRMVVSLGGGALPGLVGYLTGLSTDLPEPFRYTLFLGVGFSFLSLLPLFGIQAHRPTSEEDPFVPPTQTPPTPWRHLATFTSISAFRGLAMGITLPFFPVFFQEMHGASTATIGFVFFLSQALGLPATVAAPALSRRFGPTRVVISLRLFDALSLAALGYLLHFPLVAALFLISTALDALTSPAEMAFATNALSRPFWARMQSGRVSGYQFLYAFGSVWAGKLILSHGYALPFALAALARICSATIFLTIFGFKKSQIPKSP